MKQKLHIFQQTLKYRIDPCYLTEIVCLINLLVLESNFVAFIKIESAEGLLLLDICYGDYIYAHTYRGFREILL